MQALQKDATHSLPRFSLERKVFSQYLRSRAWLLGLATDLGGGLLMIVAFALAPVSIVQPVSGLGLVALAVFSHFYLRETLRPGEWAAIAVAGLGVVSLGASAQAVPAAEEAAQQGPSVLRVMSVLLLLVAAALGSAAVQLRRQATGPTRRTGSVPLARQSAALCGLQAGACFGLSAGACRTGFLLAQRGPMLWVPAGILGSTLLTSTGLLVQTQGLKEGNTVVVCTCAAVSSMVSGVLVGLLALGESMPSSASQRAARLLSWALIFCGVGAIGAGPGMASFLARQALQALSRPVLVYLPAPVTIWLQSLAEQLPVHAVHEASTLHIRRQSSFGLDRA